MIRGGIIQSRRSLATFALTTAPFWLYVAMVVFFSVWAPKFPTIENFINIATQASSVGVVAIGMTFVLLTAGIDLSVGSMMFLAGTVAGSLVVGRGWPIPLALSAMLLTGLVGGVLNGLLITRLRMAPFIVTLATLFVARGLGLWITETRAINLPDTFRQLATAELGGVRTPVFILLLVMGVAETILRRTGYGRRLYAIGYDSEAARKGGVDVDRALIGAYALCGLSAAIGGMIALAQLAAVSPDLGQGRELAVIAAAVLGGTSLFGGRGTAIGSVLGALLIETVRNGLNLVDANPYIYPLVTGGIIFVAVLLDSLRHRR